MKSIVMALLATLSINLGCMDTSPENFYIVHKVNKDLEYDPRLSADQIMAQTIITHCLYTTENSFLAENSENMTTLYQEMWQPYHNHPHYSSRITFECAERVIQKDSLFYAWNETWQCLEGLMPGNSAQESAIKRIGNYYSTYKENFSKSIIYKPCRLLRESPRRLNTLSKYSIGCLLACSSLALYKYWWLPSN